jgi:hypothetical protein
LISLKRLPEEKRRFIIRRKGQITSFSPNGPVWTGLNKHVLIGIYDERMKSIRFDGQLYDEVVVDEKHFNVILAAN